MKQTIIAILPGIAIYAFISIAAQFVLHRFWQTSHVLVRFFGDTAAARELMRQSGQHLKMAEADEPHVSARLVRSVVIVTWLRYLSFGISLFFAVAVAAAVVDYAPVLEYFRGLVFVTSTIHVLLAGISYYLFWRNKAIVFAASDHRED